MSANFRWLSERVCKQCHLSMEFTGKRSAFALCSDAIGQSNCLLPTLRVSLAGIRRSFVLISPNIGP